MKGILGLAVIAAVGYLYVSIPMWLWDWLAEYKERDLQSKLAYGVFGGTTPDTVVITFFTMSVTVIFAAIGVMLLTAIIAKGINEWKESSKGTADR